MSAQRQQVHRSVSAKTEAGTASGMKGEMKESHPLRLPQTVTTRVAAEIVGRSPDTLKRWRYEGVGPEYIVFRGRVRYDRGVLDRFNDENTRMPSVRAAVEADRGDF